MTLPIDNSQIAVQTATSLADAAKSSVGTFELPSGYIDSSGSLHTTVHVREMTGDEEDVLTSRRMQAHQKLQQVMEGCVTQIGTIRREGNSEWSKIIRDLTATDRLFIIVKIREITLGSAYTFKTKCPECGDIHEQAVSLSEFVIKAPLDPMIRSWSGSMPKSGLAYTAKVQTGVEEAKIAKAGESKDLLSLGMLARLVELDGKQPVTLAMVKSLPLADRAYLRAEFDKHESNIENDSEIECPACGHEYKAKIDIGDSNFFFPSAT